jgi:hypothetical protein
MSLLILKVRLETDREIYCLFKFNVDMRVFVDTRNAKYERAPPCFRKLRNYCDIFDYDSEHAYIKTKLLVSERSQSNSCGKLHPSGLR